MKISGKYMDITIEIDVTIFAADIADENCKTFTPWTDDEIASLARRGGLRHRAWAVTRAMRDAVVELLRCAADVILTRRPVVFPIDDATTLLYGRGVRHRAPGSAFDLACGAVIGLGPVSIAQLLEAAQRVEEGSWP